MSSIFRGRNYSTYASFLVASFNAVSFRGGIHWKISPDLSGVLLYIQNSSGVVYIVSKLILLFVSKLILIALLKSLSVNLLPYSLAGQSVKPISPL